MAATPLSAMRQKCLDCSDTVKMVAYCTLDGIHSNACPLWPYRFGVRPQSAAAKYGVALITPKLMPTCGTPIENLPNPAEYGKLMEIEAERMGLKRPKRRKLSTERQIEAADRLRRARLPKRGGSDEDKP